MLVILLHRRDSHRREQEESFDMLNGWLRVADRVEKNQITTEGVTYKCDVVVVEVGEQGCDP